MSMTNYTRRDFLKAAGFLTAGLFVGSGIAGEKPLTDKRPNILLFFPDQHRYDWLGLYKKLPLRTPNIDWLASEGVNFTSAICPSPLCVPSRAILASGKEYDRCGAMNNGANYPEEQQSLYKFLRDSGYHVTACGKFDLRKPTKDWGRDGKHNVDGKSYLTLLGFSDGIDNSGKHDGISGYRKAKICPYFDYLEKNDLAGVHFYDFSKRRFPNYENTEPTLLPDDAYADNWIAQNGLKLIRSAPKDKPWFLQVNFNGPHEPMDITKSMKEGIHSNDFPQPHNCKDFTPEKHIEIRQHYAAMIENIDRWLGVYIEELKKSGQFDNTLIVYSSDHGEMLGDNDAWGKSKPYQASIGVPLVIAGPGIRKNFISNKIMTTLDLTATFLDYANLAIPKDADSRSLRPLLDGKTYSHRQFVRSGLGPWRMVFDGRYKLIRGFDPVTKKARSKDLEKFEPVLLFDLENDPHEETNIAEENPKIVERLTPLLKNV